MMLDSQGDGFTLERVYDAAIEDVWALWTTKEGLEEWFAPEGMSVEIPALELWVGGAFDHVMTAVARENIAYLTGLKRPLTVWVHGQIVEIEHHRRLRIRFDIDFVADTEAYPYDMAVELHEEAGQVRMTVTIDRHPDPEMNRGAALGLTSQLQNFDRVIARRAQEQQ